MLILYRYFQGYAIVNMVVVHPAYWRRGHGGNLVKWGMKLARIDKVKQGVSATKMGKDLYQKLGWQYLTEIHIEGDETMPQGVSSTIMEYNLTMEGDHGDVRDRI